MSWVTADALAGAKREDFKPADQAAEAPVEQVNVEQASAEPPLPASPEPQPEPAPEPTPPPTPQPEPTIEQIQPKKSWQEVLKEEGFDEWDLGLLQHKKAKGSAKEYLEAMSVDYKSMSAEDLLRKKVESEFPGISQKALEFKVKEELKKYPLDGEIYNEDEVAVGREMLEMEMNRVRQSFIEKQSKYLEPIIESKQAEEAQRLEEQKAIEAYRQQFLSNEFTKSLLTNKRLVLDGGEEKFNFEVGNPQELVNLVLDANEWQKTVSNPDGSPKIDLLLEAAAYIKYKAQIHKQLINYGKTLGEKKVVEQELHNIPEQAAPVPGSTNKNLWETIRDGWK